MSDVNLPPFFRDDSARHAQGIERKSSHDKKTATLGESFSTCTVRTHYVVCEQFSHLQKETEAQPQQFSKGLKSHTLKELSDKKDAPGLESKKKVGTETKTQPEKKTNDNQEIYLAAKKIKQDIFHDEMQKARSTMRRHMTANEYNMTLEKVGERLFNDPRFKEIIKKHHWTAYKVLNELSSQKLTINKYNAGDLKY